MPRVLAIRHHLEDHPGLIGEAFVKEGCDVDLIMIDESTTEAPSLYGYDHLLILGSKCAVYDDEVRSSWFSKELDLIHEADQRGIPIFGICFGAQALCVAFGGQVGPSANPEIGWYPVHNLPGSELPEGPFFEFHYDACTLPANATTLSVNENAVQAFTVGRHLGTQYHPEIDAEQLRDWFAGGGDDEAREFGHDLKALEAETRAYEESARQRAGQLVKYFLSR